VRARELEIIEKGTEKRSETDMRGIERLREGRGEIEEGID
jgi:hypothetical protein